MKKETFEQKLNRLKELSKQIDSSDIQLKDLMDSFEEGMKLIKSLKKELNGYELKIEEIYKDNDLLKTKQLKEEDILNHEF